MTTKIRSNGGGNPQPIEALFARLESDTLDRTFEAYGNFIERIAAFPEVVCFWGNFLTYSHVFSVDTDEPELVERLTAAIRANQQTPAYRHQPPPFDRDKLTINRKRFSTTQGEVELLYDGRRLEQYGDTITMNGRGQYEGKSDGFWENVARNFLAKEHVAEFERESVA
jgi:hypothetical protein